MAKVAVQRLEVGQKVAVDIKNDGGQVMIKKGVELTARHIHLLETWGVEKVEIEGAELATEEPVFQFPAEILTAAEERVSQRFCHVDGNLPAVQIVRRVVVEKTALRLAKEKLA